MFIMPEDKTDSLKDNLKVAPSWKTLENEFDWRSGSRLSYFSTLNIKNVDPLTSYVLDGEWVSVSLYWTR